MSPLYTVAIVAACLCLSIAAPVDEVAIAPRADENNYRLPLTTWPNTYNIKLRPYLQETDGEKRFTFDGEVEIEVVPNANTKVIELHSRSLNYTKREIWSKDLPAAKINLDAFLVNPATEKITYTLKDNLLANKIYILHFVYKGQMEDDMAGFYRSSYTDSKNVTKWLGSTQFQKTSARRAFPSFDEPKFKANFTLTITHHKSLKSVSNTHIINSSTDGDYVTDVFDTTPKMSTYIVAFIVSEFNERFNGEFGIIARPEYYAQTEYSFDVGQKTLKELDDYLGIPYYEMGVKKMHMAAIPDFAAGAMENWGLLTYRETNLLYEEGSTTLSAKQSIAAVVAHEQAHMWFGDLVTCDWWSYTWLNEGFARYFQTFTTAKVEKEMELEKQFVVAQVHTAMAVDATNNTNRMSEENAHSKEEVSRMLTVITYNKAAAVIRMVNHVMGETSFQKSLREYLKDYAYQSTVPQNLFYFWKANWPAEFLAHADPLFKNFTEEVGFPLVTVSVSNDAKSFEISQKRFLMKDNDGSDNSLLYTVPITYTTDKENDFVSTKPKFFLEATADKRVVTLNTNVNWVIANIQETGYYRVNYDTKNWHNIHAALTKKNFSAIADINRAQIVDDLFNLARSSEIEYDLALKVLEYLETETHYLAWTAAFNGYSYLATRLGTDTKNFGIYIRQLTEKTYKLLGFEERASDTPLEIYNRAKILSWSCKYRNSDCIEKSNNYFQKFIKFNTPVPVNIRSAVYCSAMREGKENEFNALLQKYNTTNVATDQSLILSSLGCVKNEALVSKFFWFIVSDDVRRQDKSSALSSLYSENNENVSPVFKLVTENHEELSKSLGGYSAVASVISNIASRFTTEAQQKELKEFNDKNKTKFGSSATVLETAENTVTENLEWAGRKLGTFTKYLSGRTNGSATSKALTMGSLFIIAILARLLH